MQTHLDPTLDQIASRIVIKLSTEFINHPPNYVSR